MDTGKHNEITWRANKTFALLSYFVLAISAVAAVDFTEFVDTKIGGSYRGHTFPGAACPFGMVQASPDTGLCDWDHCSGYVWEDPCIYGFSQTHLSGTGCPDLADVRLLPFTDDFDSPDPRTWRLAKDFRTECGRPGFYAVALTNAGVNVELTATPRVGVHRYTYAAGKSVKLLVDLQWVNAGDMSSAVVAFSNRFDAANAAIIGGRRTHAWLRRSVCWKVVFDRPWKDARLLPKADPRELAERWVLEFEPGAPLVVKAAVSTVDEDGAAKNFAAEVEGKSFDDIRDEARAKWQELLGRFEVPGASAEQRTAFYTALYHLFIQPNNIADVDGRYRGGDANVATAKDGVYYTGLSLWDTFRAAHPFYTIAAPERVDGFVNSMLGHYRALGFLPVIPYFGWESHCMIGNHSVPVIVDAYKKGFRGFDVDLAFEAVTNSLTVMHTDAFGRRKSKENWDLYDRYGYYPLDEIKGESVSRTLECSFDDWCAAEFCQALGRGDEAFFRKRAGYWKNVFDKEIGFMRGRDTSGKWRTPYDPFHLGHGGDTPNDFTEGNAFQYTWHVLQDPQGLIEAMGGRAVFLRNLDSLFVQPERTEGTGFVGDVTGLIGQYAHGNEPSHHVAYFYTLAGKPHRTADVVREVCDRFYGVKPGDLCGNDDCGQMSAWYVFAAMGFYPFNPCGSEYVIGAPQLPEVRLRLGEWGTGNGEREFRVVARNISRENKYVKSVTLNGKPIADWKIRHSDIMAGGELVFEMTAYPSGNTYPYGICAHVTRGMFGTREKAFDMAHAAGIRYVRSDIDWHVCQKEPGGEWDFSRYDEVVASAERKGVTVLPVLPGVPKWAQPVWEHLDEWSDFVRRVVERYGSRTPVVEIWNEENLEHFWKGRPDAANYVKTLRTAYKAVKSANPSVKVAFGGTSLVPLGYIRDAYRNGAKDCFDIMNVHPYANHWYPGHPEGRIDTDIRSLKSLMAEFGDCGKPIWITEVGWPTHRRSLRDFGFFGAALNIARPGKEKWNVIIAHGETDYRAEVDAYRASFPAGVTLADCTPEETERRLAAGDVDAVVFPPGEGYPAANAKSIYEFVRDGGTLIDFDVMPMGIAVGLKGASPRADRKRLRIGVDAYWMHDKTFQKWATFFATDVAKANGMKLPGGKIDSERFLTNEFLTPGDRMVTLLDTKDDKLVGGKRVAACVYIFDSDMKGRIAVCSACLENHPSYTEDEQARYIVRALGLLFAEGVEAVFPYDLRATEYVQTSREDFFGIAHSNYAPKPAYSAYMTFIGCRPAFSRPLESEWRDGKGLFYPQWTKPDGTTGGMIWRENGDAAEIQVAFDGGNVAFMSMYGERMMPRKTGKNAWAIPVGPSPIYFSGGKIAGEISVKNNASERRIQI